MLEETFKTIKDAKLDIELLRRKNETECAERNAEIVKLQNKIILTESKLESELKESGEKKLECKLGWCSFRVMPDKWEYDEPILLKWMKKECLPYYHTIEVVEKLKLKKAIMGGELEYKDIPGVAMEAQDPKFNYKLNGGL